MNKELRFGVITLRNVSWAQVTERWQSIETLGFDSVWVADHFVDFTQPSRPWFEAWTLLAGLATQTSRIRIGALITAIAFRNPAFLARQALTVDHLSHGRLELGLGTGISGQIDPSYAMTGLADWVPAERVARFREVVEIVDQLFRNEVSSYQGHYYQIKDASMRPRPIQKPRPPITIGAHGPMMLKIAAHHADTWSSFGGYSLSAQEMLAVTRRRNELLDEYCDKIDRDLLTLRRSLLLSPPVRDMVFESVEAFTDIVGQYKDVGKTS
jgi:alkanesulfonate monooxygenase SsuD/methylene tetrahydromethanopterin reductase-like flavin-dependent oxidoreductase (luciferase family)